MLQPILDSSSRTPPVIRLSNGGRIDFWSLENAIAGRGRRYQRVVIDEAAFSKDGDNRSDDSMMALWEKGIKPTLFDYGGAALVCSNSAGRNPDSFFYNISTSPQYGFREFHATTLDNPLLAKRAANESVDDWRERRPGGRRSSSSDDAQDARRGDRARRRTTPPAGPCRRTACRRGRKSRRGQFRSCLSPGSEPWCHRRAGAQPTERGVRSTCAGASKAAAQAPTWSASVERLRSTPSRA